MPYTTTPIPGTRTSFDDGPVVSIYSKPNAPIGLTLEYTIASITTHDTTELRCRLHFPEVLEYRWVDQFVSYIDSDELPDDVEFGLIEIQRSSYVERMAVRGPHRAFPGQRFGEVIAEADVKHYRIAFDDYGRFDIIAFDVIIESFTIPRRT